MLPFAGGFIMDNSDIKGMLISELADAFNDEVQKKSGSRFNSATGTLVVSNTFINYAYSHINTDGFTKDKVYKCSMVEDDFIRIIADDGKIVKVSINDADFTFKINPTKKELE